MIYEYRIYHAPPGKMQALHKRFREHTISIFKRHGMKVVGFWVPQGKEDEVLVYMLAFDSVDQMNKAWDSFKEDTEWQVVKAESERKGPLVSGIESTVFHPTGYSPLK